MRHLILFGILFLVRGAAAPQPVVLIPPPLPSGMTVSMFNVPSITSTSVEEFFKLIVTDDNVNFDTIGVWAQAPATNAPRPVLQIIDGLPPAQRLRAFYRVPISQAEFYATPTSDTYGTGIIVFKR